MKISTNNWRRLFKLQRKPGTGFTFRSFFQPTTFNPQPSTKARLALFSLFIVVPALSLAALTYLRPSETSASWFNDHWSYRQRISITNSHSSDLTEYQVLVEFDSTDLITDSKLQSDCDDLRFFDNQGRELDHFLTSATCNTNDTEVWVKLEESPANTDQDIFMYYGNPSAISTSDEQATFSYDEVKTIGYMLSSQGTEYNVIALEDNTIVEHNGNTINLNKYEVGVFTNIDKFEPIKANKLVNLYHNGVFKDAFVPVSWAGTSFSYFSRKDPSAFSAISLTTTASIDVFENGTEICSDISVSTTGNLFSCDFSTSQRVVRVESNQPILLYANHNGSNTTPLRPVSSEHWIGSSKSSRTTTANSNADWDYISDSVTTAYNPPYLGADGGFSLSGDGDLGAGGLLVWSEDEPISVSQIGDGSGGDGHQYYLAYEMGSKHGSPLGFDYISLVAREPATCAAYQTNNDTQIFSETLTSSNTLVYHYLYSTAYAGAWYLECNAPVKVMYDQDQDETSTWSYPMMRQYVADGPTVGNLASEEIGPGPIAHWSFDEGSGQTINDSSNQGNVGTLGASIFADIDDPSWQNEDQCISGKCLYFDGSNDLAEFTGISGLNLDNTTSSYTISAWLQADEILGDNRQWIVANNDSNTFMSYIDDTNSTLYFRGAGSTHNTNFTIDLDQWYHISLVFDNNTNTKQTFVNGQQIFSISVTPNLNPVTTITIGSDFGNFDYFQGFIDEVKIYPYARSAEEIRTDFVIGANQAGSSVALGNINSPDEPSDITPYAYWKLDDGSGTTATNEGTGGNGTITNAQWRSGLDCLTAGCLYFDGSGDYVTLPLSTATTPASDDVFTWMGWFKLSDVDTSQVLMSATNSDGFGDTQTVGEFNTGRTSGSVEWLSNAGDNIVSTTLQTDTWYHLAGTHSGTTSEFFVNGESVGVDDVASADVSSLVPTGFRIASSQDLTFNRYFEGYADEIKIFTEKLTPQQIRQEYMAAVPVLLGDNSDRAEEADLNDGAGADPILELRMDEMTGQTTTDSTDNNNDGQLGTTSGTDTSDPTWNPSCKQGGCVEFDGSDDFIEVGDTTATDVRTISFWLYPSLASDDVLQLSSTNSIALSSNSLSVTGFGNETIYVNGSESSGISTNDWSYVTVVSDSNIDADDVEIGRVGSGYYAGKIDHLKLYDYARTPAQIAYDYNRGKPIAHWRLDECEGTTIHDVSGNDLHGTLTVTSAGGNTAGVGTCNTSDSAWGEGASGRYEASLNFDGNGDVIDIYSTGLNDRFSGAQGTISAWAKVSDSSVWTDGSNDYLVYISADSNNRALIFKLNDELRYYINFGGTVKNNDFITTSTDWFHVVMSWNTTSDEFKTYFNGQQVGNTLSSLGTFSGNLNATGNVISGDTTSGTNSWSGQIDDVKIWNYALSPTQVKKEFNAGAAIRFE